MTKHLSGTGNGWRSLVTGFAGLSHKIFQLFVKFCISGKELIQQLEKEAFRVFNLMKDWKSWDFMQPGMTLVGGVTIPKPDSVPKFDVKLGDN